MRPSAFQVILAVKRYLAKTDRSWTMSRGIRLALVAGCAAIASAGCGADEEYISIHRPAEGIIESSIPFPSAIYLLDGERIWQSWHAGTLTTVYAGAFTRQRSQGVVIVLRRPYPLRLSLVPREMDFDAPSHVRSDAYRTPVRAGFVRIVGYRGNVLVLSTTRGRRLTFDVGSRTFHLVR